jgi:hypothetical protein
MSHCSEDDEHQLIPIPDRPQTRPLWCATGQELE